jgi:hypothetical protein
LFDILMWVNDETDGPNHFFKPGKAQRAAVE